MRGRSPSRRGGQLGDIGMIQRHQQLRFALEPRQPFRIGHEGIRQQLQRDIPLQPRIPGAIHLSHSTLTQQGRHFVRAEFFSDCNCHESRRDYKPNTPSWCILPTWMSNEPSSTS